MKTIFKIFSLIVLSTCLINCEKKSTEDAPGKVITTDFLEAYSGFFAEQELAQGESVSISADGDIIRTFTRQVGAEDSQTVPYPTVCSYTYYGEIVAVYELTEKYRTRFDPESQAFYISPETHELGYVVTNAQLNRDSPDTDSNSKHCENFIAENSYGGSYSVGMELLNSDQIRLHTSGGGDYVGQEVRTESTLDEIFIRQ